MNNQRRRAITRRLKRRGMIGDGPIPVRPQRPIHHHTLTPLTVTRDRKAAPSVLVGFACTTCEELFTPKGTPSSWDRPQHRDDWKHLPNHSHARRVGAR